MNKSRKEELLEEEILKKLSGKPLQITEYLLNDKETRALQEYANVVSIKRLGYNDHGPVHMRKAALNSILMVTLLTKAGEEKALMGTVAIHYVDSINRRAELGADLFPCYWGAGIISRLVERLKEAAFKELGLHRLEIRCMPDNIASVRIALKAGFTFEGTLRDYVYIPGKGFTDESVYRLLAPEYFSGSPASEE